MALSSAAAQNASIVALSTLATYISLHTASPSTNGLNEVTGSPYVRQAITWTSPVNGVIANAATITFSVAAGITVAAFGLWTNLTAGTYLIGGMALASQQFLNAGGLVIASGQITLSAA